MATIIIQRQDGTEYDLDALGFRVKSFSVPLNNNSYGYQQVGKYGSMMTTFASQYLVIPLTIVITAVDMADYNLQLLELRRIFRSDEDFYVINGLLHSCAGRFVLKQLRQLSKAIFGNQQMLQSILTVQMAMLNQLRPRLIGMLKNGDSVLTYPRTKSATNLHKVIFHFGIWD